MRFVDETQTVPKDVESPGLQVIAAGMWRCATSSLQVAFEEVLQPPLTPSMHGAYVMPSFPRMKILNAAMEEPDKTKRQRMLHQIFDGYNASSDWPGFAFLDDLLEMYPDAKVILNKRRTAEYWQQSVRSSLLYFSTWRYHILTYWVPISYWHFKMYQTFARLALARYGVDDIFTAECYDRHNQWVRDVADAHGKHVIDWEPSDGWAPLCNMLDCNEPGSEFPRVNETAEIEKLKGVLVRNGLWAWARIIGVTMVPIVFVTIAYRSLMA